MYQRSRLLDDDGWPPPTRSCCSYLDNSVSTLRGRGRFNLTHCMDMSTPTETNDHAGAHNGPCAHIPLPAAMKSLPRDARGYPVPVTVPWVAGRPQFASVATARKLIVGKLHLCGICGNEMGPGEPYYSTWDADNAVVYEAALAAGVVVSGQASPEPGGHRECILYAAMACPHLSSNNALRRPASSALQHVEKGEMRGDEASVCASDGYYLRLVDGDVLFELGALRAWHRYAEGFELLGLLEQAIDEAPLRGRGDAIIDLTDRSLDEAAIEDYAIALVRPSPVKSAKHPRNEPCPCASGLKYKHCHGRNR